MFYSKGMSHLGVPLANYKGEGNDDDNYGNSTLFPPSSLHPTSMHYTTQGGTNMNSEEKPWRWGKQKEERNPNWFLERNDEDRRGEKSQPSFSSLLFSLSPSSLLCFHGKKGWQCR